MWNTKQKALLEFECTRELAKICELTEEEVLDIVLPFWRGLDEDTYSESITWNQALRLREELDKVEERMPREVATDTAISRGIELKLPMD